MEQVTNSLVPKLTLQEVLDNYSHIHLSEEEVVAAMIDAKRKKEDLIRLEKIHQVELNNRKQKANLLQFDVIRTFMMNRAKDIFKGIFELDDSNENMFNLLCYYFIDNPLFVTHAETMGVRNPSLQKGIFLCGKFGTGKTWMMKLFSRNARQCFKIVPAKQISQSYVDSKEKKIPEEYLTPSKNPINDHAVFLQPYLGLCLDDIGSEKIKSNYGNVANVIGDLIEERYLYRPSEIESAFTLTGTMLHATTNYTAEQLVEYYGGRVTSRMREIMNFIELPGSDRRK